MKFVLKRTKDKKDMEILKINYPLSKTTFVNIDKRKGDIEISVSNIDKIKHLDISKIISDLKSDKKVKNGIISFVVVPYPGKTIFVDTNIDNLLKEKVNEIFVD